ncbi:MAG: S28 family serine protease [Calditrichia bacterium]
MRIGLAFFLFLTALLSCSKTSTRPDPLDNRDILEKLQALDGLEVKEILPQNGFERQFEVYITQPLDHNNPAGAQFKQRIFISHRDETRPVIFMPSGYSSSPVKVCELSGRFQANQIYVAHRFMAGAEPTPRDWTFLTIQQASVDFHRVVEALKPVYTGSWMSYGISKNGQAALFHRRYFPKDVLATVVLGAPLSLGTEDSRYDQFLQSVGTIADRNRIKRFQRNALLKRDEIIPQIQTYLGNSQFHFSRMTAAEILEFEVLEFPFSFWQTTDGNCSQIPDSSADAAELFDYLKNFGYFDYYSDELLEYFQPVYYQAYTELGWYRLIDDHLQDLLQAVPNPSYRRMAPPGVALNFNTQLIPDIINWLQSEGNNIIYIYGEKDPWTAGAIESVGSTNALKIVQPGANHALKIALLDQSAVVYATLEQWLGI